MKALDRPLAPFPGRFLGRLSLKQLRWLGVVLPLIFLGALDFIRHAVFPEFLHAPPGSLVIGAVVAAGTYLFSKLMFDAIETMQAKLSEQNRALAEKNRQLKALHAAGLGVVSELELEAVLGRVVGLARELTGAKFGAVEVLDEDGRTLKKVTSPGDPGPRFDPGLGVEVPILARGRLLGRLYLAHKTVNGRSAPFGPEDREVLELFATQAAVAIENARLYQKLEALAVVAERERIARELHDNLAQVLGYLRMRVGLIQRGVEAGDLGSVGALLTEVGEALAEAYADVREAILGLRSRVGVERPWLEALREYVGRFGAQSGLLVEFSADPEAEQIKLPPRAEVQLLRIIQEALSNVRKHARASRVGVEVRVDRAGGRLKVEVADDGCGFEPEKPVGPGHFGLAVMRERAELAGGRLWVDSAPGRGTRVAVEIPLSEEL